MDTVEPMKAHVGRKLGGHLAGETKLMWWLTLRFLCMQCTEGSVCTHRHPNYGMIKSGSIQPLCSLTVSVWIKQTGWCKAAIIDWTATSRYIWHLCKCCSNSQWNGIPRVLYSNFKTALKMKIMARLSSMYSACTCMHSGTFQTHC